ncbi:hypothetical protein C0Q70_21353 [Pomacea canaliculata]|uniref:Uncharacterized protein n=1 Tax=Pomacea canaliculata TaxID=400727 RepID=A0A2T7NC99_POMCA|nr:uncharacterized protein LOC112555340 [Pomacea canaliculata]PVD18800.1 hypothetical protein C0Q70_21353 [Pomacea canaliculata]
MLSIFSIRSGVYKTGVVILFLAAVLELVAFVSPYWAKNGEHYSGLWKDCQPDGSCSSFSMYYKEPNLLNSCDASSDCKCKPNYQITIRSEQECILAPWFHAARGLQVFCFIYMVIAVAFVIFLNARRATDDGCYGRVVEAVTGCAGVTGLTGGIVYLVCLPAHLNWCLIVSILTALLFLLSAGLVAYSSRHTKHSIARLTDTDNRKLRL